MRLLLSLMLVICATFAYADDPDISDGMKDKGTHGVVNTFSGWLEFPQQIRKGYARGIELDPDRPALARSTGTFLGLFRGASHAIGRTTLGIYQLVGFWSAGHPDNDEVGVPLDHEYGHEWGKPAKIEQDALPGYWGRKAERGAVNLAKSPIEVPYQLKTEYRRTNRKAFGKSAWLFSSRAVTGIYELVTFPFPSATETEGNAFPEREPGVPYDDSRGEVLDK